MVGYDSQAKKNLAQLIHNLLYLVGNKSKKSFIAKYATINKQDKVKQKIQL